MDFTDTCPARNSSRVYCKETVVVVVRLALASLAGILLAGQQSGHVDHVKTQPPYT